MKLYLASYRIPNVDDFVRFVGLSKSEIKIAVIFNAKDHHPTDVRKQKYEQLESFLVQNGFNFFEVDLRNYQNDPNGLGSKLEQANAIWVNGGNTFVLRYAMAESGFDKIIKQLVRKGVIYAGDSAGAIVAGPTLSGLEAADDPTAAPKIINQGLHLTETMVLPHWDTPKFKDALTHLSAHCSELGLKTVPLRDDQALLINDSSEEVK